MFAVNKSILFAAIAALSGAAFADPVVYTAVSLSPGNTATGFAADSRLAMSQYISSTVQTFDFESTFVGDTAAQVNTMLTFTGGTAPIKGSIASDGVVTSGAILGRFNTTQASPQNPGLTGANGKYWQARAGAPDSGNVAGSFSISFDRGISALGFYITDIGDFEGQLTMTLTPVGGGADVSYTPPTPTGTAANGDLLYWGFYDLTTTYSKITFTTSGASATADFFGFDDLFVADKSQIVTAKVPEPSTIALVGLALAGVGLSARKRKTA